MSVIYAGVEPPQRILQNSKLSQKWESQNTVSNYQVVLLPSHMYVVYDSATGTFNCLFWNIAHNIISFEQSKWIFEKLGPNVFPSMGPAFIW